MGQVAPPKEGHDQSASKPCSHELLQFSLRSDKPPQSSEKVASSTRCDDPEAGAVPGMNGASARDTFYFAQPTLVPDPVTGDKAVVQQYRDCSGCETW